MAFRFRVLPCDRNTDTLFLAGRLKRLWSERGDAMVAALQNTSGHNFGRGVTVRVGYSQDAGLPWSGSAGFAGKKALTLTISRDLLPVDEALLWLLMHELGHRLLEQNGVQTSFSAAGSRDAWDEQEHRLLFAFLIDALFAAFSPAEARKIIDTFPGTGYSDADDGTTRAWRWALQKHGAAYDNRGE